MNNFTEKFSQKMEDDKIFKLNANEQREYLEFLKALPLKRLTKLESVMKLVLRNYEIPIAKCKSDIDKINSYVIEAYQEAYSKLPDEYKS